MNSNDGADEAKNSEELNPRKATDDARQLIRYMVEFLQEGFDVRIVVKDSGTDKWVPIETLSCHFD